jgi:hypothetical protein
MTGSDEIVYPLWISPLLAETRFLASKNEFGHLTGMRFSRRQLKNWWKASSVRTTAISNQSWNAFNHRMGKR